MSREGRGLGRGPGRLALPRPSVADLRASQENGRALRLSGFAFGFSPKLGAMLPDGTTKTMLLRQTGEQKFEPGWQTEQRDSKRLREQDLIQKEQQKLRRFLECRA